ncbi:MAG: hypothetical protein ABI127_03050 [Dokdonella sp.]
MTAAGSGNGSMSLWHGSSAAVTGMIPLYQQNDQSGLTALG